MAILTSAWPGRFGRCPISSLSSVCVACVSVGQQRPRFLSRTCYCRKVLLLKGGTEMGKEMSISLLLFFCGRINLVFCFFLNQHLMFRSCGITLQILSPAFSSSVVPLFHSHPSAYLSFLIGHLFEFHYLLQVRWLKKNLSSAS